MNATKELILQASLCLFNQEGYQTTSARQIARMVRISQGNLRYHFPSKEAIGQELFEDFHRQYRTVLAPFVAREKNCTIAAVLDAYRELFRLYYDYRFILQDLWSLTRSLPAVKRTLQDDYQDRRRAFRNILDGLAANGNLEVVKEQPLLDRIIYLQLFVGDCWMAHSGIYFGEDLQEEVRHYLEHWVCLLLPYLTVSGLESVLAYRREHPEVFFEHFARSVAWHLQQKRNDAGL